MFYVLCVMCYVLCEPLLLMNVATLVCSVGWGGGAVASKQQEAV